MTGTAISHPELFPMEGREQRRCSISEGSGSVEAFTAEDVPDLNGWLRLTFDAKREHRSHRRDQSHQCACRTASDLSSAVK